mmetsp:Transcript_2144/g.4938  ORF Transcript_2144/g.4938 Transcript_2144/m.4938 type:complete len:220 (-) Transcript_2144:59-718(-)
MHEGVAHVAGLAEVNKVHLSLALPHDDLVAVALPDAVQETVLLRASHGANNDDLFGPHLLGEVELVPLPFPVDLLRLPALPGEAKLALPAEELAHQQGDEGPELRLRDSRGGDDHHDNPGKRVNETLLRHDVAHKNAALREHRDALQERSLAALRGDQGANVIAPAGDQLLQDDPTCAPTSSRHQHPLSRCERRRLHHEPCSDGQCHQLQEPAAQSAIP